MHDTDQMLEKIRHAVPRKSVKVANASDDTIRKKRVEISQSC